MNIWFVVIFFMELSFIMMTGSIGLCKRSVSANSNTGTFEFVQYFCCDSFQQKGVEMCKACPVGFTSKEGSPCKPCAKNTFGVKCSEKCKCNKDQRCDNVLGCMKVSTNVTTDYSATPEAVTSVSIVKETRIKRLIPTRNNDQTSHIPSTRTTVQATSVNNKDDILKELIQREIMTYAIGVGIALLVIGLGTFSIYCCCKHQSKHYITASAHPTRQHQCNSNEIIDTASNDYHKYHEIDEREMCIEPIYSNSNEHIPNVTNENLAIGQFQEDGYIYPLNTLRQNIPSMREADVMAETGPYEQLCISSNNEYHINISSNSYESLAVQYLELEDVPSSKTQYMKERLSSNGKQRRVKSDYALQNLTTSSIDANTVDTKTQTL